MIEQVLSLVNCKVLEHAQLDGADSYVLSESSMFVFRTHFVLKTCGVTTLLHAVQPMLTLARDYCNFDLVDVRRKRTHCETGSGDNFSKSSIVAASSYVLISRRRRTPASSMR